MRNFKKMTKSAWIIVAAVAALGSGCALKANQPPEQSVKERAALRWQALTKGDMQRAYDLLMPSYRATTSLDRYRSQFGVGVKWIGAEVASVACEQEKCLAKIRIEAQPSLSTRFGDNIITYVDETWLLEAGEWWFFQQ